MTIFCFGSINLDHIYSVSHLPAPGETIGANAQQTGLGGKGANQSVAAARAGSVVHHIGMVGPEGDWALERMQAMGVDTRFVGRSDAATGHAVIVVDQAGENSIVTFGGANHEQSLTLLNSALDTGKAGDILLIQNEANLREDAARAARERHMPVIYSAAPFKPGLAETMLPLTDVLVLNAVEAAQLSKALGVAETGIPVPNLLVTKGAAGAEWYSRASGETVSIPAFSANPVDTTGAGDCFIGYTAAGLDQGMTREAAMRFGAAASAIKVTRRGTADAFPTRAEVDAFMASHP
jgi:ribokinase